jgi:hypothetical protein
MENGRIFTTGGMGKDFYKRWKMEGIFLQRVECGRIVIRGGIWEDLYRTGHYFMTE